MAVTPSAARISVSHVTAYQFISMRARLDPRREFLAGYPK
jgi:hypothetical protein